MNSPGSKPHNEAAGPPAGVDGSAISSARVPQEKGRISPADASPHKHPGEAGTPIPATRGRVASPGKERPPFPRAVAATRGRSLSRFPLGRGIQPRALVARGMSVPALAGNDRPMPLDGNWDQLLAASLAPKFCGHLKPPTRGTVTTT